VYVSFGFLLVVLGEPNI